MLLLTTFGYAADNFAPGFPFDGVSGLHSGANLEDLVTEATFVDGAFAAGDTNALFDGVTITNNGTGQAKVAAGGIGSTELANNAVITAKINNDAVTTSKILDGTIGTNDVSVAANALYLNSTGWTNSSGPGFLMGFPELPITTNMFTQSWDGTAFATFTNLFDGDITTTNGALATLAGSKTGTVRIDLGAQYNGWAIVTANINNTGGAGTAQWTAFSARTAFSYGSTGEPDVGRKGDSGITQVVTGFQYSKWVIPINGRYIYLFFVTDTSGAANVSLCTFDVYANTGEKF